MAGDWIKMRGNLWDDPRIARICDLTDSTEGPVIGALYWLWAAADQHTENGIMPGLTLRQIDRKTGLDGFGEALCQVGWLADHPEGVRLVKFEEHNGESAKKRCQTAKRVAKFKSGNAQVTQVALPDEHESVSGALPREEKRREEEQETSKLTLATARPTADQPPALAIVPSKTLAKPSIPDCPHLEVLALWAEVLPSFPQHDPERWRGSKADHLRVRWRETATAKGWQEKAQGLAYFRKLFGYVQSSRFLSGRSPVMTGKRPFVLELEWLVNPTNWDKVHEGKYHEESAA